jgi:hypothetical protein
MEVCGGQAERRAGTTADCRCHEPPATLAAGPDFYSKLAVSRSGSAQPRFPCGDKPEVTSAFLRASGAWSSSVD